MSSLARPTCLTFALLVALLAGGRAAAAAAERPNVLFILCDDLGWRDLGVYGGTFYATPHMDALAGRGMRFTQGYAANPTCSPTRASIMTGLYPARLGITLPVGAEHPARLEATLETRAAPDRKLLAAESCNRLVPEYHTLAESLRDQGYATAIFGKWHLGPDQYGPRHQGFDTALPDWNSGHPSPKGYLAPWGFRPEVNLVGQPGEHIEDRLTTEAIAFLEKQRTRPFFLYFAFSSPHSPFQAKPDLVARWRTQVDPGNRHRNPTMAAMIETLDDNVGRLIRALDDLDLARNTIIVLTSDNGGRVYPPLVGGLPATDNHPLREGKGTIYEGGTRVPLIVVWPCTTAPASQSDAVVSSIDFYPTILDMLGIQPREGQAFDGVSVVPALHGRPLERDAVFCHYPEYFRWSSALTPGMLPSCSVRAGDWKLIRFFHDSPDGSDRFELFDLRADVGEHDDQAAARPEKVVELNRLIDTFLADTRAIVPVPNPAYRPDPDARRAPAAAGGREPAADPPLLRVALPSRPSSARAPMPTPRRHRSSLSRSVQTKLSQAIIAGEFEPGAHPRGARRTAPARARRIQPHRPHPHPHARRAGHRGDPRRPADDRPRGRAARRGPGGGRASTPVMVLAAAAIGVMTSLW